VISSHQADCRGQLDVTLFATITDGIARLGPEDEGSEIYGGSREADSLIGDDPWRERTE
jgi:hypothetical protein